MATYPLGWSQSGKSHSPPNIKPTEEQTIYNPFWIDLSVERMKLDPHWFDISGIVVNWLVKEDNNIPCRLILGIEATKADAMKAFLRKFVGGSYVERLTDEDINRMLLLGHPTLACEIRGGGLVTTSDFVQANYSGVIGGELHYGRRHFYNSKGWYINYNSGRYGPQHHPSKVRGDLKKTAKSLFYRFTGERVTD
ncbi:hypothetical protein HNQ59_003452 [Chitinivorax tropicus]|uniref:Uncharacterized protein n=1 Tax=Chitinivorax tropicus TaxID=714531 RepID=A0A840MNC1_9PROT|nr:hypothetical protein [Chitinivorax tropicus]MBB5020138.1 hypothetical protein [Chitinivorax tropicus]